MVQAIDKNKEYGMYDGIYGKYYLTNYSSPTKWYENLPTYDKSASETILLVDHSVVHDDIEAMAYVAEFKYKPQKWALGNLQMYHNDSRKVYMFIGTDVNNPFELGGEVEFGIEDEIHIIDKPCMVTLPAGMKHGPINVTKVKKPFIQMELCPEEPFCLPEYSEAKDQKAKPIGIYDGKYGRYFCTNHNRTIPYWFNSTPNFDFSQVKQILHMDTSITPPDFTGFCWGAEFKYKPEPKSTGHPQNIHPNSKETLFLIGSDPDNPHELAGEVEFYMNGEKHVITKPCLVTIPKAMPHGPMWFRKVDKPMIQGACLPDAKYYSQVVVTD